MASRLAKRTCAVDEEVAGSRETGWLVESCEEPTIEIIVYTNRKVERKNNYLNFQFVMGYTSAPARSARIGQGGL